MTAGRTFVVGDVHGEREPLERVLAKLPFIAPEDTLVFLGDYLDRGPDARGVIERLRRLPEETAGKVVFLRGNHEDAWIESIAEPQVGFLLPVGNGCAATYRSYVAAAPGAELDAEQFAAFDFWAQYAGKRLVFGHTPTCDLPPADPTRTAPWRRGPLWGIDTGAGRGGPLTAIALPDGEIFTSA